MADSAFPFAAYRAIRFRTGVRCPHCAATDVAPWGGFSGRRRYRCLACRRTFSDFTGTPFAHLKRLDAWPVYRLCLLAAASVRKAAELASIHRDTAFRWRHRFLRAIREADSAGADRRPALRGAIHLGDDWLPHSEKGARPLDRAPRRTGFRGLSFQGRAAWIGIACAEESGADSQLVGRRRPTADSFAELLAGRAATGVTLVSRDGEYGPAGLLARRADCFFERRKLGVGDVPDPVAEFRCSLAVWLERFRGVATRYLDNYLRWHRWVAAAPQWRCEPLPWLIGTTTPADRARGDPAGRGWRWRPSPAG